MKVNKMRFKVLYQETNNHMHQYIQAGKYLCRKDPGGPGGHQAEHKPAFCPCSKEGQESLRLHQEEHCQQATGGESVHSALVRHNCSAVVPQHDRGTDIPEKPQQTATKVMRDWNIYHIVQG